MRCRSGAVRGSARLRAPAVRGRRLADTVPRRVRHRAAGSAVVRHLHADVQRPAPPPRAAIAPRRAAALRRPGRRRRGRARVLVADGAGRRRQEPAAVRLLCVDGRPPVLGHAGLRGAQLACRGSVGVPARLDGDLRPRHPDQRRPARRLRQSHALPRRIDTDQLQGCSPKKEVGGRLKQDLDKDF